jgi:hydroxymethylglutaryl-CoA reductase (NADPH)
MSGDKKANALAFTTVRGKKVTAEVRISGDLVRKRLHAEPKKMVEHYRIGAMGSSMIGAFGVQGHYSNGLTALFMACGQDVACVAESAVGVSRLELTDEGDLYASVTMPNIMVGTVGGGTGLPSQKICLEMMGLHGADKARALAEVATAVVMAGELSINGAMACHEFTRAHQRLARGKQALVQAST